MSFWLSKKLFLVIAALVLGGAVFFGFARRTEHVVPPSPTAAPAETPSATPVPSPTPSTTPAAPQNPLTAEECTNAARRPIAVMLSGDAIARPLSGIGEADMVFEMPVITGSITRFMAVYICRDPIEIGSVRSARHDFIPLARGLDAIYAHWGGSHFAMDLLKKHAIDNIDALPNPVGAFYRKEMAPAPHNGFTSMTRLLKAARFLNHRLDGKAPAYPHIASIPGAATRTGMLEVGFPGQFRVRYAYDPESASYQRIRGGATERDKNTGDEVRVRNIVVMRAESRQIEGQYNDVKIEGKGNAMFYRGGEEIFGTWEKDPKDPASRLIFIDKSGAEVSFLSGNIWVEIVEPYTDVNWQSASVASPPQTSP